MVEMTNTANDEMGQGDASDRDVTFEYWQNRGTKAWYYFRFRKETNVRVVKEASELHMMQ